MGRRRAPCLDDKLADIEPRNGSDGVEHAGQSVVVERIVYRPRWWDRHEGQAIKRFGSESAAECVGKPFELP